MQVAHPSYLRKTESFEIVVREKAVNVVSYASLILTYFQNLLDTQFGREKIFEPTDNIGLASGPCVPSCTFCISLLSLRFGPLLLSKGWWLWCVDSIISNVTLSSYVLLCFRFSWLLGWVSYEHKATTQQHFLRLEWKQMFFSILINPISMIIENS